jgi:hypothetical protein
MEMMAPLWWTPDFLARFEKGRGYSAVKYLPVFFQARNLWNGYGDPYDTSYSLDGQPSDGGKYAEDYRLTLTEGYQDFLRQYQVWAAARGMSHSAQPAYNMPLDMVSKFFNNKSCHLLHINTSTRLCSKPLAKKLTEFWFEVCFHPDGWRSRTRIPRFRRVYRLLPTVHRPGPSLRPQ